MRLLPLLLFRSSLPRYSSDRIHTKQATFKVNPFGLLQLRVSDCSPQLISLDYNVYPDNDHVVVSSCDGCQVDKHRCDFSPTNERDFNVLSISCINGAHADYCGCIIQVPNHIKLDISANGDADVKLSALEPSECHISSDYGTVHMHKIKSEKTSVFSNNGSVEVTGYLTGNIHIKTGISGFVRADRLQGSHVKVDTFEGPIRCKAVYGKEVDLSSREGDIAVQNLQADHSKVWSTHGNVNIGSLDGDLTANLGKGSLAATVANTKHVKIASVAGDVSLGLATSLNALLRVESPSLPAVHDLPSTITSYRQIPTNELSPPDWCEIFPRIQDPNDPSGAPLKHADVEISTESGRVKIFGTSWFSSLNLGKQTSKQ